jgi:hypothetical protein
MIFTRIALFVLLATAAWAEEALDYTKDPAIGVKRAMTKDPKTTDSQCVGDPKTPVCALETMLACLVRQQPELCRKMGIRHGCFDKSIYGGKYIITRANHIELNNYRLMPVGSCSLR